VAPGRGCFEIRQIHNQGFAGKGPSRRGRRVGATEKSMVDDAPLVRIHSQCLTGDGLAFRCGAIAERRELSLKKMPRREVESFCICRKRAGDWVDE